MLCRSRAQSASAHPGRTNLASILTAALTLFFLSFFIILTDSNLGNLSVFAYEYQPGESDVMPSAVIEVTIDDPPAVSEGEPITFTVTLSQLASDGASVQVDYVTRQTSPVSAREGIEYQKRQGTLVFTPGTITQTVTVNTIDNLTYSGGASADPKIFLLVLSNPRSSGGDTVTLSRTQTQGAIRDNDNEPTMSINDVSIAEGDEPSSQEMVFRVTLSNGSDFPISVDYILDPCIASLCAEPGVDFTFTPGTLRFTGGDTTEEIRVTVFGDNVPERDEVFYIALQNATNVRTVTQARGTGTIVDSRDQPVVQFSEPEYTVVENEGRAVITVTMNYPHYLPVTLGVIATNGSAIEGRDYSLPTDTQIHFPVGSITATFIVNIPNDTTQEQAKALRLDLTTPDNGVLGTRSGVTLTILDDDNLPQISVPVTLKVNEGTRISLQVSMRTTSNFPISVEYVIGDDILLGNSATAISGTHYVANRSSSGVLVFPPGTRSQTIELTATDDVTNRADTTLYFTLVPSSTIGGDIQDGRGQTVISILDNDGPTVFFSSATYSVSKTAAFVPIEVRLSFGAAQTVTVRYKTDPLTAEPGKSYENTSGTLEFRPLQDSHVFTITILNNDQSAEDEDILLTLSSPGRATLGTTSTATLTLLTDLPKVQFSTNSYTVTESLSSTVTAVITVSAHFTSPLNKGPTVVISTENGRAMEDDDYVPINQTLVFSPVMGLSGTGVFTPVLLTRTFTVEILNDLRQEAPETVLLHLSNPQNARLGSIQQATLNILDNSPNTIFLPMLSGPPPTVQFGAPIYTVDEDAGTAVLTVTVSGEHRDSLVVSYVTIYQPGAPNGAIPGVDYITSTGRLTFPRGLASEQQFTIPIVDDNQRDGIKVVVVLLNVVEGTVPIGAPASATLQIIDDDQTPGWSLTRRDIHELSAVLVRGRKRE